MPEHLKASLKQEFGYTPVIATEIEFYLHGAEAQLTPAQVLAIIEEQCAINAITLFSRQQERGVDQYEVALMHSADLEGIILQTLQFKQRMKEAFSPRGITADFRAKPAPDQPGSGLHVHVHLEDGAGRNVFVREDELFSPPLLHSIGGLLALMNASMPLFAPVPDSYRRFQAKSNAPVTLSWGINNRTTALRLPNKPLDGKHIEHRVAGSDADVGQAVAAILAGIHYGLQEKILPPKPVYGDASLPQYDLPRLARSLEEVLKHQAGMTGILKKYGLM